MIFSRFKLIKIYCSIWLSYHSHKYSTCIIDLYIYLITYLPSSLLQDYIIIIVFNNILVVLYFLLPIDKEMLLTFSRVGMTKSPFLTRVYIINLCRIKIHTIHNLKGNDNKIFKINFSKNVEVSWSTF